MTPGVVCSNDHVANSKSFFVLQADSRFPGSWSQTTINLQLSVLSVQLCCTGCYATRSPEFWLVSRPM